MIAQLPAALAAALEDEISESNAERLRTAAQSLSSAYRSRAGIPRTLSPLERGAYLAVRFPSTFAVASAVWRTFAGVSNAAKIETVADLGAGPGTASLAAREYLPTTTGFTLVERDPGWRATAERLARATQTGATFRNAALPSDLPPHDVIVACYALGEQPASEQASLAQTLCAAARNAIVVIEPGTPAGFALIRQIRDHAIEQGFKAAAPCTHNLACPMSPKDWCHQPVRVARAARHRAVKQAPLPFEDEKFSYVILTRDDPIRQSAGRIVRKPIKNPGHVHLDICTEGELKRISIGKSAGPAYRNARDAAWGEEWPSPQDESHPTGSLQSPI